MFSKRRLRALMMTLLLLVGSWSLSSSLVYADQSAEELPGLFEALVDAETPQNARKLEREIWGHWLLGPDKTADQLMTQIQSALQLGRHDIGLLLCNQLVDAYPSYAEGWNKRATIHYLLNKFDESVADIQTTLDLEPRHFGALSGLGLILMSTGDAEGALLAFESVLALSPASESAKINAARAREQLGLDI